MESHVCSAPRAFTKVVKTPQEFGTAIPKGLAKALGVTERTIARWHHFREGPPRVEFGRKVFYRLESVKAWLEGCEHPQARANRGERSRPSRKSRIRMYKGTQ